MASIIPKSAKLNIVGGASGYATKTLKLMLLKPTYVPLTSHDFIDDVSGEEITDLGSVYVAGGVTIAAGKVGVQHGDNAYLDFDNISIGPGATVSYRYGALYVDTGNPATSEILAIIDFGATQSVTSGTSTIQWNALGVIYVQ